MVQRRLAALGCTRLDRRRPHIANTDLDHLGAADFPRQHDRPLFRRVWRAERGCDCSLRHLILDCSLRHFLETGSAVTESQKTDLRFRWWFEVVDVPQKADVVEPVYPMAVVDCYSYYSESHCMIHKICFHKGWSYYKTLMVYHNFHTHYHTSDMDSRGRKDENCHTNLASYLWKTSSHVCCKCHIRYLSEDAIRWWGLVWSMFLMA